MGVSNEKRCKILKKIVYFIPKIFDFKNKIVYDFSNIFDIRSLIVYKTSDHNIFTKFLNIYLCIWKASRHPPIWCKSWWSSPSIHTRCITWTSPKFLFNLEELHSITVISKA